MNPRVLIVEDIERELNSNEKFLIQIDEDRKSHLGIGEFIIHKAKNKEEAIAYLQAAVDSSLLYDLLLLDLGLPLNETATETPPERGLDILEFVQRNGGARGTIVLSVFQDYDCVVEAFRRGAVDYIAKPFHKGTLQEQVLKYFELEGVRLLEQRIKDLMPFAEKGLAHRLGVCFSRFVQSVVNETEGLEDSFKERWGLDVKHDAEDSEVRHLITMEEAVTDAKSEWAEIVCALLDGRDSPGVCLLEKLLAEIEDSVRPCLALKQLRWNSSFIGETCARTFRNETDDTDDTKAVLREIILGAMSELTNHDNSREKRIEVSISTDEQRAHIRFEDTLPLLNESAIDSINKGIIVSPGKSFGRAWGLSVAQHLAMRGGGKIRADAENGFNVITYSIPLADHA